MRILQHILLVGLRLYRVLVSPVLGVLCGPFGLGCRFTPTCSQYAMEAIQEYGPGRGLWMALRRLAHCHPWGGSGVDPVPPRISAEPASGHHVCRHGS